ncbi:MAG: DUF4010 domain-containing protein [Archangium sp.]|nr:DUF4010 domain-containing protein [Archangium sp.]
MERYEPFVSLALAALAGLLIGLEREQSRPTDEEKRPFLGGIRTYPLIGLLGAVAMMLSKAVGPWALVTAGLGLATLLALSYWRDSQAGHGGITSEASALLTFFLGAFSLATEVVSPVTSRVFVVASIAVISTLLLSGKTELRQFSSKLSRTDVIATLKFLVVAVVALPVLPNEPLGPYGVLNPFRIGVMVALIAGIGFVGYVAMRLWGAGRGMLVTGAVGGLASSTAVTLAAAARARQAPALAKLSALAVIIASTVMCVRLLVVLFIAEPSLGKQLIIALGTMAAVGLASTAFLYFRGDHKGGESGAVALENPFELSSALKFGALFVVVLIVSRWAQATFGTGGAYVTGLLAGTTDVDAISLSMANLVKTGEIELQVARNTVVLAAVSNTVVKAVMAMVLGGGVMGRRVVAVSALMLAAALIVVIVS